MDYDTSVFKEIRETTEEIIRSPAHTARLEMNAAMKVIYRGDWSERDALEAAHDNIKVTIAPDARNAIVGARRLMTATEESWKVPDVQKSDVAVQNAAQLEKFARLTWAAASSQRPQPLRVDIATSLLVYSNVQIQVVKTTDLYNDTEAILKNESDATRRRYLEIKLKRAGELKRKTPYMFVVWDPSQGYSVSDEFGLNRFVRKYKTTVGALMDTYGYKVLESLKMESRKRNDPATVFDEWDLVWHQTRIEGAEMPLMQAPHGLDFIPIVDKHGEGTTIFEEINEQLEPFLYTAQKTGWYDRQNLAASIMSTSAFLYAGTPPLVYEAPEGGGEADFRFSHNPPYVYVPHGGKLYPLNWTEISKAIEQLFSISQNAVTESTMFKQTLGAPLGNSATYSYVALLNQSGRLPLTPYQKQASMAIAEAMKLALLWSKQDSGVYRAQYGTEEETLTGTSIPEEFDLECKLDVALPQDKLGTSQVALNLHQIGKLPWEWIATNLLDIEDWQASLKKWSKEQLYGAMVMEKIKDLQLQRELERQKKVAEFQQAMAPPQLPPGGGEGSMGPPDGGGMNGEMPGYGGGLGDAPAMPDGIPGTIKAGASPVPPQPITPSVEPPGYGV